MADDGLFLLIRFGRDEIQAAKSCWVFDCGATDEVCSEGYDGAEERDAEFGLG